MTNHLFYIVLPFVQPSFSTIEDIYTAVIETDRGVKEKVRIFDTGSASGVRTMTNIMTFVLKILHHIYMYNTKVLSNKVHSIFCSQILLGFFLSVNRKIISYFILSCVILVHNLKLICSKKLYLVFCYVITMQKDYY